jgi:hypothetical protein
MPAADKSSVPLEEKNALTTFYACALASRNLHGGVEDESAGATSKCVIFEGFGNGCAHYSRTRR